MVKLGKKQKISNTWQSEKLYITTPAASGSPVIIIIFLFFFKYSIFSFSQQGTPGNWNGSTSAESGEMPRMDAIWNP
jgi:hypothetical protein